MRRNFENSGYTGGVAEQEVFGKQGDTLTFPKFKEKYRGVRLNPEEMIADKGALMEDIRGIQVDQEMVTPSGFVMKKGPTSPSKYFAGALRKGIENSMREAGAEHEIRFYTSVHTVLDYRHGIDAFVDVVGQNPETGEETILDTITYDVTMRDEAGKDAKTDVSFQYTGVDPRDDKEDYDALVDGVVSRSMEVIESREILTSVEK